MSSFNEIIEYVKDDLIIVKRISKSCQKKSQDILKKYRSYLTFFLLQETAKASNTLLCSNLFNNYDRNNSLRMATAVELLHIL